MTDPTTQPATPATEMSDEHAIAAFEKWARSKLAFAQAVVFQKSMGREAASAFAAFIGGIQSERERSSARIAELEAEIERLLGFEPCGHLLAEQEAKANGRFQCKTPRNRHENIVYDRAEWAHDHVGGAFAKGEPR